MSGGYFSFPGSAIRAKPFDERSHALFDWGIRSKPNRALEVRTIGAGLQNIAGLHWQKIANGRATDGLLDQPNEFDHLDRLAIPDM